jgi:Protein of unknown function (DUF4235)
MLKLLYKPIGIVVGIVAGLVSRRVFDRVWGLIDDEKPPKATTQRVSWGKVLGAAAIEGLTFSVTRAAVNRAGARGWERLTGVWPGKQTQDSDK